MKKLTLPLLLLLIAFVGFIYFVGTTWEPIDGLGPGGLPGSSDPANPGELSGGPGGDRDGDSRSDIPDRGDRDPNRRRTGLQTVTVTGRCLDERTRIGIAGCEVEIIARARTRRRAAPPVEAVRVLVRSGTDGRFSAEIRSSSQDRLELKTRVPGHADMEGHIAGTGRNRSLGDILIPSGAFLIGRVEDENGVPLPDVSLRFFRRAIGRQPGIHPTSSLKMKSDGTGALSSDGQLACQSWNLSVTTEGARVIKPGSSFEITTGQASQHLVVVVKMPDPKARIRGHLVDEDDNPIPQAMIRALGTESWAIGFGYSKPDGSFTVRCRKEPGDPVRLSVPLANGFEKLVTTSSFAWGSEDVKLVMERASGLKIEVVEKASDDPVEDYQVIWYQVYKPGERAARQRRKPASHHPDGKAVVEGIPRGDTRLVIIPTDENLAPNDPIEFVKASSNEVIRIALTARVPLEVRVTDARGQAIVGTAIELLRSHDGSPITPSTRALNHENLSQLAYRTQNRVTKLDSAKTDDQGIAELRWSPSAASLAVRVLGPGHIPLVQEGIVLSERSPRLQITVRTGARLVGRLHPLSVLKQLGSSQGSTPWRGLGPRIMLRYKDEAKVGNQGMKSSAVGPDGDFEFEGLISGPWEIQLQATRFFNGRSSNMGKTLGRVNLSNGATRRVSYDISDLRPASLRGRVYLNGVLATQSNIQLTRIERSQVGAIQASQMLRTDDQGSFHAEAVAPGRYTVAVEVPGQARRRARVTCSTAVLVPPGGDVSQDFHAQAGALRIRITNADGSATAKKWIQVIHETNKHTASGVSDAEGVFTIPQLPVGEYVVKTLLKKAPAPPGPGNPFQLTRRGQFIEIGRVSVTPGSNPPTIQLTLPAK